MTSAPKWQLTQQAFDELLGRLDEDRERAGEKYQDLRTNLIRFFEWRGCAFPEDNADETINRVARKINEGEQVRDLIKYSLGVAWMMMRELHRNRAREDEAFNQAQQLKSDYDDAANLARTECLRNCLRKLSPESRELIVEYYRGEKRAKIEIRKSLAERLKVSVNTLRMKASRLRDDLETCVEECLKKI
jgi:DNA-directed RNA polymerase specialized sigma24 family protein